QSPTSRRTSSRSREDASFRESSKSASRRPGVAMQPLSDVLSAALSTTAPDFLCPFHWDGVEPAGRRPAGAARVGRGRGVAHKTAASSGRPSGPARRPPRRVRPSEPWCLAQAPDPEGGTMLTWDDLRSIDAISDPLGVLSVYADRPEDRSGRLVRAVSIAGELRRLDADLAAGGDDERVAAERRCVHRLGPALVRLLEGRAPGRAL